MVEEKIKEVEEITAEKEELESDIQNALQKLWAKETELHNQRESSVENEKRLLDSLKQEKAHSQQLEIQVQLLTNQNEMLQEQVFQLEHKLSVAKEHAANAEHKLPLECTNESLRTMTLGLMDQIADGTPALDQNNTRRCSADMLSSPISENASYYSSSSEKYSDRADGEQDDLSEEFKAMTLREQNNCLQGEMKTVTLSIEDLWHKITDADFKFHDKTTFVRKDSKSLLRDIYRAYCKEKSKVVDLNEQNARQLRHLEEVQEALCVTEGRIQRIWVNFSLHEEKDEEIHGPWTNGDQKTEVTEGSLEGIESLLSRYKATLEENQDLKRLSVSYEDKLSELKGLVAKLRQEAREISKELEIKCARWEELRLSMNKIIEDKDIEIEILKEQLQEKEKREKQINIEDYDAGMGTKCPDEILEKLLRSKENDLDAHKRKHESEELGFQEEIRDLREALEKVSRGKNDLQEYCNLLKEALQTSELESNAVLEREKSLKESIEQGKKREEKLYLVARELYEEVQIEKHEAFSHEATSTALFEKVKCLEMAIQAHEQERQVDKKNLKNSKETEQYLQCSLQQALGELFELKAKHETVPEEGKDQPAAENRDEQERLLLERLEEVGTVLRSTLEKAVRDLQENVLRVDEFCEENKRLRKELNQSKMTSNALKKSNLRLEASLQAMKDNLLDEVKAKKELEVLLVKSNDKWEPKQTEYKYNQSFDEQSTSSQLPGIREADTSATFVSTSESCLQSQKKSGKLKGFGKRKLIPKAISKHLSSSSSNFEKSPRCDILEKTEITEREQRLRNILMTVQRDKEVLEQDVESLSDELQRAKAQLQNYENLNENMREEANRNVRETLEIKKILEVIYGRTKRAHRLINKDIHSLLEISKAKDKQLRKCELFSGQYEKENTELQRQAAALKEKLEDEVSLKDAALGEIRQLRLSLQNVLESKEKCVAQSESPLLITNLNSDLILPHMGKEEVRTTLKEILVEIENSNSEEINRLKQRTAKLMEELCVIRQDNEYLRNLVDAGLLEELQKAEERITFLIGQLKVSQERHNVLREASIQDKVKANDEVERLYERYAEMKITIKNNEGALERSKEMEEALINENNELHEELESFKERFGADGLLPITEKAETKRAMEGWKRKCLRLQESFEKEKRVLKEENTWLHRQLAEESSLCTDLRHRKAELENSLEKSEEKIRTMHRNLEERQDALACLEERRVILETKLSCLQRVNGELQNELSKERSEAERNLLDMRTEFEATAKDLKRHQREGNNLVTKVFLLENAKEKLQQELNEKERKMTISLESLAEERSRLSEKVRDLRISLEEEVRRRLDLEEKMQQIVKISVMEKEQNQLNAIAECPSFEQIRKVRSQKYNIGPSGTIITTDVRGR